MVSLNHQMVLILCHIFKIILNISQKHETFPTNPPIHVYSNRIMNILVFKTRDD